MCALPMMEGRKAKKTKVSVTSIQSGCCSSCSSGRCQPGVKADVMHSTAPAAPPSLPPPAALGWTAETLPPWGHHHRRRWLYLHRYRYRYRYRWSPAVPAPCHDLDFFGPRPACAFFCFAERGIDEIWGLEHTGWYVCLLLSRVLECRLEAEGVQGRMGQ